MNKPTGKQRRAMAKLQRRLQKAVADDQVAKTPSQKAVAQANGIRAISRIDSLARLFAR